MVFSLSIIAGITALLVFSASALVSWFEREPRAAGRLVLLAGLTCAPFLFVGLVNFPGQDAAAWGLLALTAGISLALIVPTGSRVRRGNDIPTQRFDERNIMFSRARLEPGTERFESYYRANPGKKNLDDRFREKPGLTAPGATYYDPLSAAAANASFEIVAAFHPLLDNRPAPVTPPQTDPDEMTHFIKQWGKKLGAVSVGVTTLQPYHLYSVIGRGAQYGEAVTLNHRYAIALTVEMNQSPVASAPYAPIVMESAQQYLNAGAIALQLAEFIHQLGYPARAHIDANYRVICPLVARDAGLGEIGRMGLLMTPELGPRVRLAVVTTDLPLTPDARKPDLSVLDFCTRCKKCADTCPSKAIPFDDRAEIDGALRWRINSEACFTYWCAIGTDCGRCMSVCPYSHPDNLMHNLIRSGVRNSWLFRDFALLMDDFLYGRKPNPRPAPGWIKAPLRSEKNERTQ